MKINLEFKSRLFKSGDCITFKENHPYLKYVIKQEYFIFSRIKDKSIIGKNLDGSEYKLDFLSHIQYYKIADTKKLNLYEGTIHI